MKLAFQMAEKGRGFTSPNPPVGAILVKNGKIISEGFHSKFGGPHAEMIALKKLKGSAPGATLYVSLEPCSTYGKTPPCTQSILKSALRHVVIGTLDPNPIHHGKGVRILKEKGISVEVGICEKQARELIEPFAKWVTRGIPFCTIKSAASLDGKIATALGESKWITSPKARKLGYELRKKNDAVMIGVNTLLKDDPQLTTHQKKGYRPIKIIVDSRARTPLDAQVIRSDPENTVIATTEQAVCCKVTAFRKAGVHVLQLPSKKRKVDLEKLFRELGKMGICSVLVEGGGELSASILEEGLADRIFFFYAPILIGGRDAPTFFEGRGVEKLSKAIRISDLQVHEMGQEILVQGRVKTLCFQES